MISLSPWLLVAVVFAVITLGVVAGFAITRARRLDRLHQRILASRDSLSRLLSRAIRETLTPDERARIASDPEAGARLEALDATCYRIELTRNVHNVDVAGVRVLRSARMVKLLRLAGHAPIPEPIDFDDDTRTGGRGY